jgi:tetratricopeptide (TPR) repeat protein
VGVSEGTTNTYDQLFSARSELAEAERLRVAGDLVAARSICELLNTRFPGYYGVLHTLGLIHADLKDLPQALSYLAQADAASPDNWQTLAALAGVYLQLGARTLASRTLDRAAALNDADPSLPVTAGEIAREEREYEAALAHYERAVALAPTWRAARIGLAQVMENLGRYSDAAAILEALIQEGDATLEVVAALTMLPASTVSLDLAVLIDRVRRDPAHDPFDWKVGQRFAKARILDGFGDHEAAWRLLVEANAMVANRYRAERDKQRRWEVETLSYLRTVTGRPYRGGEHDSSIPVSLHILGPSRAGKTTVEKLVGTSPEVKVGYENPIALNAVRRAFQLAGFVSATQYPLLPPQLEEICRSHYLEELRRRAGSYAGLTNTSPARIHDAARMAEILPNTKFIFVARDRIDLVFRIFAKLYKAGNFYSYDIHDVSEHVDWYYACVELISEKFGDLCAIVSYEEVLRRPEMVAATAQRLCGISSFELPSQRPAGDVGSGAPYRSHIESVLERRSLARA